MIWTFARLLASCAAGATLKDKLGLAGLSWSFVRLAASTWRATRMDQIGDKTRARRLSPYRRVARCRTSQGTTTRRSMAGSRICPS
jgi:hypothetical protein